MSKKPRVVMAPGWHHLLFLHWAVEPDALRRLLPPGLELDLWQGRAYVGLVPFSMTQVRPNPALRWVPGRFKHENFHETNVRTYVRCEGQEPGVWFFSLDAASLPAVVMARVCYKLPYFWARMSLHRRGQSIKYTSRRLWPAPLPAECRVRYTPIGVPAPAGPGSLEEWLVERYRLYSHARRQLFCGRVAHRPYQIQGATLHEMRESCLAAVGIARPDAKPHILYARKVQTTIYPIERVTSV